MHPCSCVRWRRLPCALWQKQIHRRSKQEISHLRKPRQSCNWTKARAPADGQHRRYNRKMQLSQVVYPACRLSPYTTAQCLMSTEFLHKPHTMAKWQFFHRLNRCLYVAFYRLLHAERTWTSVVDTGVLRTWLTDSRFNGDDRYKTVHKYQQHCCICTGHTSIVHCWQTDVEVDHEMYIRDNKFSHPHFSWRALSILHKTETQGQILKSCYKLSVCGFLIIIHSTASMQDNCRAGRQTLAADNEYLPHWYGSAL